MKVQYIIPLCLGAAFSLSATSCSSDNDDMTDKTIVVNAQSKIMFDEISEITGNSATIHAYITAGSENILDAGFVCSENENPSLTTEETSRIKLGSVETPVMLSNKMKGLRISTTYNVAAYAITKMDTVYSAMVPFTTTDVRDADALTFVSEVSMNEIQEFSYDTASFYGQVDLLGSGNVVEFGFCVSESEPPTLVDNRFPIDDVLTEGTPYYSQATGLESQTTYFVRMYVMTEDNVAYSDTKTFTTTEAPIIQPTVSIAAATNVEEMSATLNAKVTEAGNIVIMNTGFVYGTTSMPTVDDTKVSLGGSVEAGTVSKMITGLTAETMYYVRYFIETSSDVIYSDESSFTTKATEIVVQQPAATLADVATITTDAASFSATITTVGNQTVEEYGFCYGTTATPTISDSKLVLTDTFSASTVLADASGLTDDTMYYVRFYIKLADSVIYTEAKSFTTEAIATGGGDTPSVPVTDSGSLSGLGTE